MVVLAAEKAKSQPNDQVDLEALAANNLVKIKR